MGGVQAVVKHTRRVRSRLHTPLRQFIEDTAGS
jgi:hypothetical protein